MWFASPLSPSPSSSPDKPGLSVYTATSSTPRFIPALPDLTLSALLRHLRPHLFLRKTGEHSARFPRILGKTASRAATRRFRFWGDAQHALSVWCILRRVPPRSPSHTTTTGGPTRIHATMPQALSASTLTVPETLGRATQAACIRDRVLSFEPRVLCLLLLCTRTRTLTGGSLGRSQPQPRAAALALPDGWSHLNEGLPTKRTT